jgi:hypothetical protein
MTKTSWPPPADEQLEVRMGLPVDALYQQARLIAAVMGRPEPQKPKSTKER